MIPWFAQSAYEGQHMRHVVADEKIVSGRKKRNLRDGVGFIDPENCCILQSECVLYLKTKQAGTLNQTIPIYIYIYI